MRSAVRKKILYGFMGLVGLVLGVLIALPWLINFESYKPLLTQRLEDQLGRRVVIEGPVRLSTFPMPSLVVERVQVEGPKGGSAQPMLTLPKTRLDLALLPLLHKEMRFNKVQLFAPTLNLEVLANGKGNWVFEPTQPLVSSGPEASPESPSGFAFNLAFDKVEVLGANLHYKDKDQEVTHLEDLTTTLSMESLTGPLEARGAFKFLDKHLQFHLNMKKIADKTPLKLTLTTKGIEASLKGDFLLETQTFQGDLHLASDIDDLEEAFSFKSGMPDFLREPFTVAGYVSLSPQGALFQHVELLLEGNKLEGSGEIELAPLRFSCDLRGLPGGVHLKLKGLPQTKGVSGHVDLSIKSPRKFLKWTRLVEEKSLPSTLADRSWDLESAFLTQKDRVALTGLSLSSDHAALKGDLSYHFDPQELVYDVTLKASNTFLKTWDISLEKGLEAFSLSGRTRLVSFLPLSFQTQTKLSLPQGWLSLKGTLSVPDKGGAGLDLDLSGALTQPFAWGQTLTVRPSTLSAHCQGDSQKLSLTGLKADLALGRERVGVKGDLTLGLEQKPQIVGTLALTPLPLDALFQQGALKQAQLPEPSLMLVALKAPPQENPAFRGWSKTPLDFTFLKKFEGSVVLTTPLVTWGDVRAENLSTKTTLQDGLLDVDMRATLLEGAFTAGLTLTAEKTSAISLKAGLDNGSLKKLLAKVDAGDLKVLKGTLEGLLNFKTSGNSMWALVNHLEGTASLFAANGAIGGIDLKSLSGKLKGARDLKGLGALFSGSLSQGQTAFSQASLALEFHKGVGRVGKLLVTADSAQATGTGWINLPAYTLDIVSTVSLTDYPDFPPFSVRLSGPLNDPQKSYDFSQLQGYMLQNIFSKLLKGAGKGSVQDMLSGLLGGEEEATPKDTPTPHKELPAIDDLAKDPARAIGGLLKGLL